MDVAVIIPVYNGERYLREALDSVISQSVPPSEIIVVDDGSTDQSHRIARSFSPHVRLVLKSNGGTASARNHGVKESGSPLLSFLDQDDLWMPNKLELQLEAIRSKPQAGAVFGHVQQFVTPDLPDTERRRFAVPSRPQRGYSPSSMLIKRSIFLDVGYFDENCDLAEWIEWNLRLVESPVETLMLDDVVCRRRIHAGNKGVVKPDTREYLRVLKQAVDRRRKTDAP